MKVLVAGTTGFIGSAVTTRFVMEGKDVSCLVFEDRGQVERAPEGRSRVVAASATRGDIERALEGRRYDVVVNLAGAGVNAGEREPSDLLRGNVVFPVELLLALRSGRPRLFLDAGSWSGYGAPREQKLLTEDHALEPDSFYGASKAAAELMCRTLARDIGIGFVTLRLFNVFGEGETPHRLIPYVISCLTAGREAELTEGRQVRDLVHVDDVAEAFVAAASMSGVERFDAFNVCSGKPTSVREVAEMVADSMGKPRDLLGFGKKPSRGDEPAWMVGDPSRIEAATGWKAKVTVREGIERMIAASEARAHR